jgi:hypothetical protein
MLPSFLVRAKTQRRKEVCVVTDMAALFVISRYLKFDTLRVVAGALCAFASLREIFPASAAKTAGVV